MQEVKRVVSRYEVLRELGRGGMATVYLARQSDLDRLVALKELGALQSADPSHAQRFLREARLAGSVSHPGIVTVYDFFEEGGIPYIAMEYVERGSLRPYVGRTSLAQIGGVLEVVLAGLTAAEKEGIVHRDLKPENLLVTDAGRVKIADFGIAKATNRIQDGPMLTTRGSTIGTPNYMAPEQALAHEVGPWTDLYALGIIAFELFIAFPPFGDTDDPMSVLFRQVNEPVPAVTDLDPGIDPRISDWIAWLVAKEPRDRPQSADAAWDRLEDTLISILGPRWRRGSRLPALPAEAAGPPGPATPPPPGAPVGPLTEAHLGAFAVGPTKPLEEPRLESTVPPRRPQVAIAPPPPAKPRRRRKGLRRTVLVLVAVLALAAAALGRTGGGSQTPAGSSAPTGASSGSTGAASKSAGQGAPARAVQQIPDSAPTGGPLASQAHAARTLAKQYDAAAAKVARLQSAQAGGSPGARLVAALRRTAKIYRRAASAASAGDAAGYAAALSDAEVAKNDVRTALAELGGTTSQNSGSSQAPSGSSQSAPPSPCAGDSTSDDPSDDSCNP